MPWLGGRLVGFLLSDAVYYTGIDVSPETSVGTIAVRDAFMPFVHGKTADLFLSSFEEFNAPAASFDMAITSPPYFDTEQYIGGRQSHETHSNYQDWRDGFYTTLIAKTFSALKPGGVFVLQVGSQSYPLLADGKRIAKAHGFIVGDVLESGMTNNFNETETMSGEVILPLTHPPS